MEKDAIVVNNLNVKYKDEVFRDLTFTVKEGAFHALIGPNGAGKTTLIKTLVGAFSEYKGEIIFPDGKNIGYIPENTKFPNFITAKNYLIQFGILDGLSKKETLEKVDEIIKIFKYKISLDKKMNNYSSGQKKLIMLIQALLKNPKILIMDEPAANLDPTLRAGFFNIVKKINEAGVTVLITSHIISEISGFVDGLTIINKKKAQYTGEWDKKKDLFKFYTKITGGSASW